MLKLLRMRLSGFKSFSDATEVVFPQGITAVIGPNGCGKSNIADAINWVLGEQSARSLRGASMQDVIFNGSEARRPVGLAEVTLTLNGTNGTPGEEPRDVVITRRLFRSGESEYLLDGARSRLKDIQDLLREAHVGAQTYAIIEQGRIDQILNAKPRDRRMIIEDAAGVSGFKHKRRLAELKLEATHANLLRVNDIVVEVARQINSLKRQAARARRYKRLRDELRSKGILRFSLRARTLDAELLGLREEEARARDRDAAAAAQLAAVEAEALAERLALDEARRSSREASDALHQLDIEIGSAEATIRTCREKIADAQIALERLRVEASTLSSRRSALDEDLARSAATLLENEREVEEHRARLQERQEALEAATRGIAAERERTEELRHRLFDSMNRVVELRNGVRAAQESLGRIEAQRARLGQELEEARSRLEEILSREQRAKAEGNELRSEIETRARELREREDGLLAARRHLEATAAQLASAREQEHSATARLRTLEDIATRFAGVSDGVRMLLTSGAAAGVRTRGVVADFLEASRDVEGAAEAYLQGLLPAVILEDDGDAQRAASLLRSEGAGRTYFLCRSQPTGRPAVGVSGNGKSSVGEEILADPRVIGRLSDRLRVNAEANGVVKERIGDAVLVRTLEGALDLHRRHPEIDYLTVEGDVVYASGVVAAGGLQVRSPGLLAHRRQTEETRVQLVAASGAATSLLAKVDEAKSGVTALEQEVSGLRHAHEAAERRRVELDLTTERRVEERQAIERRIGVLEDESSGLGADATRVSDAFESGKRDLGVADATHAGAEQEIRDAVLGLGARDSEMRSLVEETARMRAELAAETERLAGAAREQDRAREALTDLETRMGLNREESERAEGRAGQSRELLAVAEADLARHLTARERRRQEAAERDRSLEERAIEQRLREESLGSLRGGHEAALADAQAAELARTRAEADRRHLDDLCLQELGAVAAAGVSGTEEIPEGVEPEALEAEIAELKESLDRIGPVNLMAIEEYAGLEERHTFLTSQRKDLEDSMESLKETIRRINRTSRERFTEAFEAIRASYDEIFKVLFNGGRADLRLEEEDVLECGIEMIAQPPGKRLGHVSLLSGGEKAMSAIALLFAIFRYQPSPFCLLDEVDAALDDVNVGRFTRMLREYAAQTQFILITHNKWSMESADLLYGVTMQEPGVSRLVSIKV